MASFDPTTMATQLATAYTQPTQTLLDAQSKTATATSSALTKLQSALKAFDSALDSLSAKKSLQQLSATVAGGSNFTASASSSAVPGSYSLFVEQVASSHQVAFQDLPAAEAGVAGKVNLGLKNGTAIEVDLSTADLDGNGSLSYAEIARAINGDAENGGKITASVATVNGKSQLLLSSGVSGKDGEITVSATGTTLDTELNAAPTVLAQAQNAIAYLGGAGGIKIEQGSNTITAISGVSINLVSAQTVGSPALTLTVAQDGAGTQANVKSFVDAYNTLETAIDSLTAVGKDGAASAAFASDSGVRSLKDRLSGILRQDFGGLTLRDLGINADRNGQLSLDSSKLNKTLAAKPDALDQVFGSTSISAPSGALGAFSKVLDSWTDITKGQIKQRQTTVQAQQKAISDRQARLDRQYNDAYTRYLKQFTALQQLQSQLSDTTSMLSALGSTS